MSSPWQDVQEAFNKHGEQMFEQMQEEKQIQSQEEIVVECQLVLDQLDYCFAALKALRDAKINDPNDKKTLTAYCSLAVSSINIFGSMCSGMNERTLGIASYRLRDHCSEHNSNKQKDKNVRMLWFPYVSYLQRAINGEDVEIIPAIKITKDSGNWDGNKFLGQYLGAQHKTDNKIEKYIEQKDKLENEFEAEWQKNKQKPFQLFPNKPQKQAPTAYYQSAGIPREALNLNHAPSSNIGLNEQLMVEGDVDMSDHKEKPKQGGKGRKGKGTNKGNSKNSGGGQNKGGGKEKGSSSRGIMSYFGK